MTRLYPNFSVSVSLSILPISVLSILSFYCYFNKYYYNILILQHVFADTLRSLAVITAALIAEWVPAVTSEEADATAALVVSFLILMSLLPLFSGMYQTYTTLQLISHQEQELVLQQQQQE